MYTNNVFSNKKIVLGITGGIAAYKSAELIRILKKNNCEVKVVMTKSATEFVAPLTYQTLSQNTVYQEMFNQEQELQIGHISLARWADFILIAPASANIIAKIATGIADDLLSTICLAAKVPIILSPAMNEGMWLNSATQANIQTLHFRNIIIVGPDSGFQACGDTGPGRMLSPKKIVSEINKKLSSLNDNKILNGIKVMVTAGPTREAIDPVRFLSNHSSGKMGYAIAEAAHQMGAKVKLISGPVNLPAPSNINVIKVEAALEMHAAVMNNIDEVDIYISTAAVADYRPENFFPQKHKKTDCDLSVALIRNPDILADVASLPSPPFTVGFSAETENLMANAKSKLKKKKLNMIAANIVGHGSAFGKDENEIIILDEYNKKFELGFGNKTDLAIKLLKIVGKNYEGNRA
jgi:phosphopantothenoylcysteine decarboxylase / phosphopantothenate---cysteine ligase